MPAVYTQEGRLPEVVFQEASAKKEPGESKREGPSHSWTNTNTVTPNMSNLSRERVVLFLCFKTRKEIARWG